VTGPVSETELSRWLNEGERMMVGLDEEADVLVARAKQLRLYARRLRSAFGKKKRGRRARGEGPAGE